MPLNWRFLQVFDLVLSGFVGEKPSLRFFWQKYVTSSLFWFEKVCQFELFVLVTQKFKLFHFCETSINHSHSGAGSF